jgi:hypothetical protein
VGLINQAPTIVKQSPEGEGGEISEAWKKNYCVALDVQSGCEELRAYRESSKVDNI